MQEFSEQFAIDFPLISDPQGAIKRHYGSGRVTYLVDRDGLIRYRQQGVPDNRELLAELEKLQP